MDNIEKEYKKIKLSTLEQWERNHHEGNKIGLPYDRHLLGVTTGIKFNPTGNLLKLLDKMRFAAAKSDILDITTNENLHFTFLALSPLIYKTLQDFPVGITELKQITKFLVSEKLEITKLRIVPLKNAILLAGIPSEQTLKLRDNYVLKILNSKWAPHIIERYKGHEIPPLIWHTTLVRSKTEFLPLNIRTIFNRYKNVRFNDLKFAKINFIAASYNWATTKNLMPK